MIFEEGKEVAIKVQEMGLTRVYKGIITRVTPNSIFIDDEEILLEFIKSLSCTMRNCPNSRN